MKYGFFPVLEQPCKEVCKSSLLCRCSTLTWWDKFDFLNIISDEEPIHFFLLSIRIFRFGSITGNCRRFHWHYWHFQEAFFSPRYKSIFLFCYPTALFDDTFNFISHKKSSFELVSRVLTMWNKIISVRAMLLVVTFLASDELL